MKTESLQQKKHLSLHPFGASPNWSPNSTCRFCLKELLHRTCVQGCPRSWQSKIAFIIADFPASAEHNLCSTNQQTFQWHFHLMEPVSIQKPSFDFFNSGLIRLIMFNIYILWLYMTFMTLYDLPWSEVQGPHVWRAHKPCAKSTVFFCSMKTHWTLQVDADWCRKPCSELGASKWLDLTWTKNCEVCEVLRSLTDMS
jgi:hypothetical protein